MPSSIASSSNFGELLEPGLRKVFFETYAEIPEQYPQIYNVNGSTKAKETDFHVAGISTWDVKESMGSVNYDTIDPGDEVTYEHIEYAKGIQVERKFVDDEMYGIINKLPADLARKGRITVEQIAANVLNNGFTTNGYDGHPLFDDDHPLKKTTTTGDNKLVLELTDANLKTALTQARKGTVDDNGLKVECNPKRLIVPPDLEFTALLILQSALQSGTAENNANTLKGRLSPVVMDYLTDTNAWFLQDPAMSELNFFWRVRPEFNREKNFDTMIAKYIGYMRAVCGYSDWRGLLGSNPS